jgi:hypothetical protein
MTASGLTAQQNLQRSGTGGSNPVPSSAESGANLTDDACHQLANAIAPVTRSQLQRRRQDRVRSRLWLEEAGFETIGAGQRTFAPVAPGHYSRQCDQDLSLGNIAGHHQRKAVLRALAE